MSVTPLAPASVTRPAPAFRGRIGRDARSGHYAVPRRYRLHLTPACPDGLRIAVVHSLLGLADGSCGRPSSTGCSSPSKSPPAARYRASSAVPPRRFPPAGGALLPRQGVPRHRERALRLLARRRDRGRPGDRHLPAGREGRLLRPHRPTPRHPGSVQRATVAAGRRPVIFQADDSDEGREFAASSADAVFSRYGTLEGGQAFYADVKRRLAVRTPPGPVAGSRRPRAPSSATPTRRPRNSPRRPADSGPAAPPPSSTWSFTGGGQRVAVHAALGAAPPGRTRTGRGSRRAEPAEAHNWSIRDLVIETGNRQNFIGSPATVAKTIDDYVQADAADGFILVPHLTPTGLDAFADQVVPLLQERGVFRTEYEGATLRDHLGLDHPDQQVAGERLAG